MGAEQSHFLLAAGYGAIGALVVVAILLSAVILLLAHLVGPKRSGPVKDATYESGMEPFSDARRRFHVRFYLVAVLFLIFDVELIFLYPLAVLLPRLSAAQRGAGSEPAASLASAGYGPVFLLVAGGLFFALLLVGLVYEWRRGVFKWN